MNQSTLRKRMIAVLIAAITVVSMTSVLFTTPARALLSDNTLQLNGSSTVYPISNDAIPGFPAFCLANTGIGGVTVTLPFPAPGSGTGWADIGGTGGAQSIDVAESSKFPSLQNVADLPNATMYPIGIDSIAIIVHSAGGDPLANYVKRLNQTQIMKIFTGQITNWDAINSSMPSTSIGVVVRTSTSGTADCFQNFFLTPYKLSTANITHSAIVEPSGGGNQGIITFMSTNASSESCIAYVGLGFTDVSPPPNVQPVWVAFDKSLGTNTPYVWPSKAHVLDGTWLPYRYLFYATPQVTWMGGKYEDPVVNCWISYVRQNVTIGPTGPNTNNWVVENGYIQLYWGDFTNSTNVPLALLGGAGGATPNAGCPKNQPNYPDQKVNYDDIVFFADAYIQAHTTGHVNPLCDWNGDGVMNVTDIHAFLDSYTWANM